MRRPVLRILAILVLAAPATAGLVYLDATSGVGGNTSLAGGSTFSPPLNGTTGADNHWEQRTPYAASGNIFESGGETAEDAPEIKTTLSGLTPGAAYRVYVHFWDAYAWRVRAGFSSNPGANPLFASAADAAGIGATSAALASDLAYSVAPTLFVEADRTMYAALVGIATADAGGELGVFVDDGPPAGANSRTWFDGVSYEPVLANPVTYVDAITANTTRWDGHPFAPAAEGITGVDHNWEARTLGTNGNVFESNGEAGSPEDAPLLVTTLTGLAPDTQYVLYGYFWGTAANWRLKAAAAAATIATNGTPDDRTDDFLPTAPATHFAAVDTADGTATLCRNASLSTFVTNPLFTEGDRTLKEAPLGVATSDGTGSLTVYVDDLAYGDQPNRTWYDGVGFKRVVALDPAADEDGDGLVNGDEATLGTDPYLPDTDGDTFSDGVEVAAGSNPLDRDSVPPLPGNALAVAPDGAWTWFNDERAIFHQGSLFTGYVKGDGQYGITRYDPAANRSYHMIVSTAASRQQDDHNNPSLTVLPDGKLLVLYSKHGSESRFYRRISLVELPSTDADWGPETVVTTPAGNTYANTYALSGESNRIYNFHRCLNYNPTLTLSNDNGVTWGASTQFIKTGTGGTRPYARYCSDHTDRIDLIYTDGHPRDVNNSLYHLYYRDGAFRKSDGTVVKALSDIPLDHDAGQRGSVIYQYSTAAWGAGQGADDYIPSARAWSWDIHYGRDGNPVCVFQVQRDNVGGSGWTYDRIYYYYARWTGAAWQKKFIAHAGRPLYSAEDDYGAGISIDPVNPGVVYFSSNAAAPFNLGDLDNVTLRANNRYEIYRGVTTDGGRTFAWEQLTKNSPLDNLRPIVPENHGYDRAVLWFHGTYSAYTSFSTRVLALLENDLRLRDFSFAGNQGELEWVSSPGRVYRITGSTDLAGFPIEVEPAVPSQGGATRHAFDFPAAIEGSPRGFFRVERK